MSEIVLAASLDLGLSHGVKLAVVILVSGADKVAGSVSVFHINHQAKESGYVERASERSPVDVMGRIERKAVQITQSWDFAGLAATLCVSGFPDTFSIHAFSVLEDDYLKFVAATFVGSCGRLVVTVISIEVALTFL